MRPELLRKSCEKTLSDLGCGYLDLFLVVSVLCSLILVVRRVQTSHFLMAGFSLQPWLEARSFPPLSYSFLSSYPCSQHWPDAWVPGANNDFFGSVTLDDQVTLEQSW